MNTVGADYVLRFVMAGDWGVGKTSMLRVYSDIQKFGEKAHGANSFHKIINLKNKVVELQIDDTAGVEAYSSLTVSYFRRAKGCVICFNLDDRTSFDHLETVWFPDLKNWDFPQLLVGTFRHAEEGERRVVSKEEATAIADRYNVEYMEVNVTTWHDIDAVFQKLASVAIYRINRPPHNEDSGNTINVAKQHEKRGGDNKTQCHC